MASEHRERVERRLAAVLAADVAGYSRLMGEDEEGTLAALTALRRELTDPKITEHRGRIVKTTGDGLLVEFPSVVDAVRCAVELQRDLTMRNEGVGKERRIEFRIGINLGDVLIEEQDIYGDGVNVAARLEALAEPGGICVSRVVRDQVRDKVDFGFEELGDQQVKNIARPPTRCLRGASTRVFSAAATAKRIAPRPSAMPMRHSRKVPTMPPRSASRHLSLPLPSMTQPRPSLPSTEQRQLARATPLCWVSGLWRWPSAEKPSWQSNGPSGRFVSAPSIRCATCRLTRWRWLTFHQRTLRAGGSGFA
jgi:class 3 adenylate cyclase